MEPVNNMPEQILLYDTRTGACVDTPTVHVKPNESRSLLDAGLDVELVTASSTRNLQYTSLQPSKVSINSSTGKLEGIISTSSVVVTVIGPNSSASAVSFLVVCSPCRINLDVQYDGGYAVRYSSPTNRISTHMAALWEFYLTEFGVEVICSEPSQFESFADQCPNENPDVGCDCGDCENSKPAQDGSGFFIENYHHKNAHNVILREVQTPLTNRRMLFIGHNMCKRGDLSCEPIGGYGIAWAAYKICGIYSHEPDVTKPARTMDDELLTVLHEFGHLIGALDHYDYGGAPSTEDMNKEYSVNTFSDMCMYGTAILDHNSDEYEQLINAPVICDGCRMLIEDYLDSNCL